MEEGFKRLLGNIKLTENQERDAITKYTTVCKALHDFYYPNLKYDGSSKVLIGSYGKGTNIRPPRDIDIVFRMPEADLARINGLGGNKQSQLLQEVRRVLKSRFPLTEEIRAFGKVVVVPFAEGSHKVEVLPAWQLANGRFQIPNSENGGFWDYSDPLAEIRSIDESQVKHRITKDFIKICKKWVEYCNVELESFIVEVVAVNYLNTVKNVKEEAYLTLMFGFLNYLLTLKDTQLLRPTGVYFTLGHDWESKTKTAFQRTAKALDYTVTDKVTEAETELKKLYGDDYTYSPVSTKVRKKDRIAVLRVKYPAPSEEYLDLTYGIPFQLDKSFSVHIDAQIEQDGYRTRSLRNYIEEKLKLKRYKSITFKIIKNTVLNYDEIRWKVRNFGDEAQSRHQLRGEISVDQGNREKRESTKYYGDHFVECYIIKNGCCVAVDRIFVPIGNEE